MSEQSNSQPQFKPNLVHQPFPEHEINLFNPPKRNPNGYLTSARLYLDGVLEERATHSGKSKRNWQEILLSPWTISSILLVILANLVSATFILAHQQNLENKVKRESSQEPSTGPNLAAREFVDLNLSSLSTISSLSAREKELNNSELEQSILAAYPDYIPTYAAHPAMTKNNSYYYILADYAGDRSLELAKAKVKHVSLINLSQGMFIYLGAFERRNQAAEFVADLQEEGMYAYIYPFE